MNKEEFRTKAYPILLEALLRATNMDNIQVLVQDYEEKIEVSNMVESMLRACVKYRRVGNVFSLENNAIICVNIDLKDGYNHTLEIVWLLLKNWPNKR